MAVADEVLLERGVAVTRHTADGKPSLAWAGAWLNQLAAAYLAGPEALRSWAIAARSDPAERSDR